MSKEKSEKSASSDTEVPIGVWNVWFTLVGTSDPLVRMGTLELAGPGTQGNTLKFGDDENFVPIKGDTFPVNAISNNSGDVNIQFQILEAAEIYNPSTPMAFRFFFEGVYAIDHDSNMIELNGTGKVPPGFYPRLGLPVADGDNVTWTSKGITDPPHKHSK